MDELGLEPKEVGWITNKKKRKEKEKEKKEEEKRTKYKLYNQLLVELQIMNNNIESLQKRVAEIEKSVTSLSFKNLSLYAMRILSNLLMVKKSSGCLALCSLRGARNDTTLSSSQTYCPLSSR